jgi:hypothetical protein
MRKNYLIVVTILFLVIFAGYIGQAGEIDKKVVQGAMHNFIRGKLSGLGGVNDIKGVNAEFDYLHKGVKKRGDLFVSCADFKSRTDVYDIDYYVREINGQFFVVKEIFHKKNGKPVNEVLWKQD